MSESLLQDLSPDQRRLLLLRLRQKSERAAGAGTPAMAGDSRRIVPRRWGSAPPLSLNQQRLWFLDQFEPGGVAYNLAVGVEVEGRCKVLELAAAVNEIVRRHESLRTTFAADRGGAPVQRITPRLRIAVPVVDLRPLPAPARLPEASALARILVLRPYDLSRGPLLRVALFRLDSERHALVVAMHHIVSDGWSLGLFIQELLGHYRAFSQGHPSPLPELPIQYADFALWQREQLQGDLLERELVFWRQRLAGVPPALDLPTDRTRPPIQGSRAGAVPVALGARLLEEVKEVGQRQGATFFMTLLAAFQVLLGRYTGQRDFVVGTPVAGRARVEIEKLIGFFVNTLLLRADFTGTPDFREFLQRVQEMARLAYTHQDLPFEKLVEELQPERDLSRMPLAQVVFALQNTRLGPLVAPGLTFRPFPAEVATAKFDLTWLLHESAAGLGGVVEYNRDLFDTTTVQRMVGHFTALLTGITADPSAPIAALPLLCAAEMQELIEWNDTEATYAQEVCLHELFERRAAESPLDLAVVSGEERLTYDELDRRANRLARHLRALGVGSGDLVAVLLDRSPHMVSSLLAILKAGAAYVPLETRSPESRMRWILEAMRVPAVLVSGSRLPVIAGLAPSLPDLCHVVCLDGDAGPGPVLPGGKRLWTPADLAAQPDGNPGCRAEAGDLAYIIFTSGSTGIPKGVMVRHRPVINLIEWVNRTFEMSAADRVLFITSLGFDLSVYDIFGLLAAGGSIRIASDDEVGDPQALVRILASEPITFWDSAPAALEQLVPLLPEAAAPGGERLRLVFLSGDWVPLLLPDQVRASFPEARMVALGGATEATVWSNFHPVRDIDSRWKSIPYGRPIENARYYVLDGALAPSPVGIAGDLIIGGECLSSGYAGEPRLTAEKYLPDPFAGSAGAVMYRTGDRARFWTDGTIEFLGRIDHQVKIHGFRIELGEIEAALCAYPEVQAAVALAWGDDVQDRRLVAYLVCPAGPPPSPRELRTHLELRVPKYMVPSAFVFLDELPVTANGKLDRKALPSPERPAATTGFLAPRTPEERALAEIWTDVLGLDRVGIDDNFFELGGDSILSIQVVARADRVGLRLTPRQLFESPTIAGLAAAALQGAFETLTRNAEEPLLERSVTGEGIEDCYPSTPVQQGMIFHSLHSPRSGVYLQQLSLTLESDLDCAAFERAWHRIVLRHPILRTGFDWSDREVPLQVVHQRVQIPWLTCDWQELDEAEQRRQLSKFLLDDRTRGFDLASPPLLRLALIHLRERRHQLVWTHHHILLDGWSLATVIRELFALYEAESRQSEDRLEPVHPFRDYIVWLERQGTAGSEHFWRRELAGFTAATSLDVYRQVQAGAAAGLARREGRFATLAEALGSYARRHRLTPNTVVQGAWALLLSRYSGKEDVVFGAVTAGRSASLPGIESMVGLFINTLPARMQTAPTVDLIAWLQEIHEHQAEVRQHEHCSLSQVQDWSEVPRGQSMFESILAFENYPIDQVVQEQVGRGLGVVAAELLEQTNYPLTVMVTSPAHLYLRVLYDPRRFDGATVGRMLGHLEVLLAGILGGARLTLGDLPWMRLAERQQVLREWNDSEACLPHRAGVQSWIEEQAVRQAEAIALVCGERALSYAELVSRTRRLARRLRRLGIGPGSLVGISIERSPEMVVGVLAILAAGGAYVPIDPSYPAERRTYMLEDALGKADAPVLLTQASLAGLFVAAEPTEGGLAQLQVIRLDADWPAIAGESRAHLAPLAEPGELAYVIYTSGSTGRPKGVALPRAALENLLSWQQEVARLGAPAKTLQFASLSFDVSFQEIVSTLRSGGKLHLVDEVTRRDSARLLDLLERERIERIFLPSIALTTLAEAAENEPATALALRDVITAGEQLQVTPSVARWFERLSGCRLHNHYGPSETHVVSALTLAGEPASWPALPAIGRPVANTSLFLLDRDFFPVPLGVPGALYIGGFQLARGYLGRPDLTAERFIPNPFARIARSARLYRTGDLARCLPDGSIEYLGRIDHQVKIRGFRVELGEIEAALSTCPGVQAAVALVWGEDIRNRRLVAYVVASAAEPPEARTLKGHLAERLPEYMVPSAFVFLEALPVSPNGKVDRKALPVPERPATGGGQRTLRTPVEELLAGIWSELLGVGQAGVDDDFFELGGHSLLAMRLMSRIREAFGIDLPVRVVFELPMVASLAARIEGVMRADNRVRIPPLRRAPRDGAPPLSFAQERLWFLHQLQPEIIAYNLATAIQLEGALDIAAFEAALDEVLTRHESLRTTFIAVAGGPVQVIAPHGKVSLPVVDLTALPAARHGWEIGRLGNEQAGRSFDLSRGPLLRMIVAKSGEQRSVMLVTMHHIVTDGWSFGVLTGELKTLYEAYRQGRPSPLPELPIQYADYALWQRDRMTGEALEADLAYWRERLAGVLPLELPTDRPRPAMQSFRGANRTVQLSGSLSRDLQTLSRRHGTTLFMTLLAAFKALLWRYTGQADISVGTPIAGRTSVETEVLIGFFVNTLVLRTEVPERPTFAELLKRMRDVTLGALTHQDLPFEKIVAEIGAERDLSRNPLFQVMFVLQNMPAGTLDGTGLRAASSEVDSGGAQFDLSLIVGHSFQDLTVLANSNRDLFDAATIERLLSHFTTVLSGAVEDSEGPLGQFPLLVAAERHQLRTEWNDTATPEPIEPFVHRLIENQARRSPDAVAVAFEGRSISYAALNGRADRLARHLRELGVGPDVRVGVCVERSLELVVGLLGILKVGGAYVPLDPAYPRERLVWIARDALGGLETPVLLTQESLAHLFRGDGAIPMRVIRLDADWESVSGEERGDLTARLVPENLSYVIYTSGSTGWPKGVAVSHRSLANLVSWHRAAYGTSPADHMTQLAGLSFDAAAWEIWACLGCGASLRIAAEERITDVPKLTSWLLEEAVTASFLPTPLAEMVCARDWPPGAALRSLLTGGDRLHGGAPIGVPYTLFNHYGPTEGTVVATRCPVEPQRTTPPPVGRPIDNTRTYVLDRDLQPVPVGVPGELCIAGAGLARGYLGRPDLTAERFLPDPAGGEPGGRVYRTGDLVRYLADGRCDFLGRTDFQVKLRGLRIELGEIEAALRRHPEVRDVVVVAREEPSGDRRLAAYVVPAAGLCPSGDELRSYLRERLPEYMIPAVFVPLETLPLTPNGKIDRRALPRPESVRQAGFVAPRSPVEEVLASLWEELLGREKVGLYDHFFELGGHSLLATRLMLRIQAAFGVELPLLQLFEEPTIEALAAGIERAMHDGAAAWSVPLAAVSRGMGEGLPLSFSQERLWFLDRLEPGNPTYNIPLAVDLHGTLHQNALTAAVHEVVRRHESLRTSFEEVNGTPRQRIHPPPAPGLPLVDLGALPVERRAEEVHRLARLEAFRSFDLGKDPLFSIQVLRLGEEHHRCLLTLHHIIADGWSLGILVRELAALYGAFMQGRPSPLPELAVQYADYAVWQRTSLASDGRDLAYWSERLRGGVETLDLPTDRPRRVVQSCRGGLSQLLLSPGTSAGLKALSRSEGATLFMVLLAGLKVLLQRHSGQEDIVVGTPIAGRQSVEVEELIGCFLNTLVLRTSVTGQLSFRELLARVREATLGAYAHQSLPFEALLGHLCQERDLSRTPLFQVLFNMLNFPVSRISLPGLTLDVPEAPQAPSKFDMTFYVADGESGIAITLVYNSDLFDAPRMADLLDQLGLVLTQATARPGAPVASLSLLTERAHALLPDLAEELDRAWVGGVHELFSRSAERAPDRPAVVDRGGAWSYGELEKTCNRLAGWLMAQGVGKGDRVAIYAHRSAPLTFAILATLKAGGVFTILDPTYPPARLVEFLSLAQPLALLRLEAAGPLPRALESWVAAAGCPLLGLPEGGSGAVFARLAELPGKAPDVPVGPDDLACLTFTSGSTGIPKGILGRHGPLSHFLPWQCRQFGLTAEDRFSLLSGLAHDPLQRDLFTPLFLGATIVVPDPEEIGVPGRLASWMAREEVTVAHLTPAMAQLVTEWPGDAAPPELLLHHVLLVGDVLTRRDVARIRRLAPRATCVNLYGSTETQRAVGFHVVSGKEAMTVHGERVPQVLPLGRGMKDVQLLVFNGAGELAGIGELGEIAVRSPHLARGYLGDENLTREKFQINPLSGKPGDRIYRTGDLGRYLPNGEVTFAGRMDFEVKVRGFRIDLGEVEATLKVLPSVHDAVVLLQEKGGEKFLVAYVVAQPARKVTAADLRAALRAQLPAYMIPAIFALLDCLPLNPNGKVDRQALARLGVGYEQVKERAYAPPRDPVEERLAEIFSEVLGIERIGVDDNFFDLGGHSLRATRVIARIRETFHLELPLRSLFQDPTVAGLAKEVGARSAEASDELAKIALALAQLEHLSEEEAFEMLQGERDD